MTANTDQEKAERRAQDKARKAAAALLKQRALELRLMGKTYAEIGRTLEISAPTAHKHVKSMMDAAIKTAEQDAERLRMQELMRLDRMNEAIWTAVIKGNTTAVDKAIKIHEKRAALLGLNAPTKVAPTDPTGKKPYEPEKGMTPAEVNDRIQELLDKRDAVSQ